MRALDTFKDVIATLPADVQVAINTAIAEGDIDTALGLLNDQLINAGFDPITLESDVDLTGGQGKVDAFIRDNSGRVVSLRVGVMPTSGSGTRYNYDGTVDRDNNPATLGRSVVPVAAGQPITNNTYITVPTANPSAVMKAAQRWGRDNGRLMQIGKG
jgi:hypothetical protein